MERLYATIGGIVGTILALIVLTGCGDGEVVDAPGAPTITIRKVTLEPYSVFVDAPDDYDWRMLTFRLESHVVLSYDIDVFVERRGTFTHQGNVYEWHGYDWNHSSTRGLGDFRYTMNAGSYAKEVEAVMVPNPFDYITRDDSFVRNIRPNISHAFSEHDQLELQRPSSRTLSLRLPPTGENITYKIGTPSQITVHWK